MDRISELPCSIIHRIMSFLTFKQVAQLCVLSKAWNDFQKSFPVLVFAEDTFLRPYCRTSSQSEIFDKRRSFVKFVDSSLRQFCQKKLLLKKFRLSMNLAGFEEFPQLLDQWLELALEHEVKELCLEFYHGEEADNYLYILPQTLYQAKGITTLELRNCELEKPLSTIQLHVLTTMSLDRVCLSEKILKNLIDHCALLEDLCLDLCTGLGCISVSKPLKLKSLKIFTDPSQVKEVEIVALSLEILELCQSVDEFTCDVDIAGCPNLRDLKLMDVILTDQEFCNLGSVFPRLENLTIQCDYLEYIMISSDQLKYLRFSFCSELKAIDLDTPNLVSFCYENSPFLTSTINTPCPWKVAFVDEDDVDTSWFLYLKEFLGMANQIEALSFDVYYPEWVSVSAKELRKHSPSSPVEVGNLDLDVNVKPSDYAALLDGFLSVCYPKTVSVIVGNDNQNDFLKWLYENLYNRDTTCCKTNHIKCWRHFLEDVRLSSFLPSPSNRKLLNLKDLVDDDARLPLGTFRFHLDWLVYEPIDMDWVCSF